MTPVHARALSVALAVALVAAAGQERGADVARETSARTVLELAAGKEVSLKFRTIAWSAEGMRRMRQDPSIRTQMNQRFQLGMQTELVTPVALSIQGRRLEADSYRVGLAMNDAGAFEFTMLLGQETVRFPVDLSDSRRNDFPYLDFSLVPCEEGLFCLVFQWGSELGRVVFLRAQ